jgi:hypothetical protein
MGNEMMGMLRVRTAPPTPTRRPSTLSRRTPRRRGIQYAAAFRFYHRRLWILDHPHARVMTTEGVACIPHMHSNMTSHSKMPSHSRGATPEFCLIVSLKREGAGNAGCPMHPQPVCKKTHTVVATGSPESSGIPCAMVLTAYSALSPATSSFLSPSSAN